MVNLKEREIISPTIEQDEPMDSSVCQTCPTQNVSARKTRELEAQLKAMTSAHELLMKNKGFILLCGCLIAIVALYVGDIFIVNLGWKNSANLDSIIELGKTIITLMLGYLFATDKHST